MSCVSSQHVENYLACPNPLCNIRVSHDYLHFHPPPPKTAPEDVPHLVIKRFQKRNPFPTVNCWKVVAPAPFNPVGEPWVHLPEGYGKVWLQDACEEVKGWRLFEARTDEEGLVTRLAFRKCRVLWWRRW